MNDEKYVYIQDMKSKKFTARSARNKRTHNGKGGSVKLPSDYMTQKEIKAMNGEVKSYRLNEPMTWKEFKAMPDDIKVSYISLLRQKYNVPDRHICKMMGTNACSFSQEMNRLGIPSTRKSSEKWDTDGFYAWCAPVIPTLDQVAKSDEAAHIPAENCAEEKIEIASGKKSSIERALGILHGISYCVTDSIADGILTAVELIESELKGDANG